MQKHQTRTRVLSFRSTQEARELLDELIAQLSDNLGARVSLSQAIEVAVREAVSRHKEDRSKDQIKETRTICKL